MLTATWSGAHLVAAITALAPANDPLRPEPPPIGWLGLLGLENGDRIDKVNGFELGTPERALEAYARLRTASHLRVELVRRGRAMTIDYHIR